MIRSPGRRLAPGDAPIRIFETPREAYTRALLAASLDPDPAVRAARRAARHDLEGPVPA